MITTPEFGLPEWQTGAPKGELDAFFAEYVGDLFRRFGYRKPGAYWTKVSPNGDTSSVWFQRVRRQYCAQFYVEPGFWTSSFEEAQLRSGDTEKVSPYCSLRHRRLEHELAHEASDQWVYGDADSRERAGLQLRTLLESVSLPGLEGLRDRWATVEWLESSSEASARVEGWARPTAILLAYLTVDVADPLDVEQRRRVDRYVERAAKHRHRVQEEVDLLREVWQRRKQEAGIT